MYTYTYMYIVHEAPRQDPVEGDVDLAWKSVMLRARGVVAVTYMYSWRAD
jgi:hypothetical protein